MPLSTLSNLYISEANVDQTIYIHAASDWGGGKAALGFGTDRLKTYFLISYLENVQNILMTLVVCSQVSDHCSLGNLLL